MSTNHRFFEQSITIKSPLGTVFKALTDADELRRWFPTRVESDPRPGGKYKFAWEFANASENGSQEGEYVEVVQNERLSYTWSADSILTLVTFVLDETNGETKVELEHSTAQDGADEKKLHDDHANQWEFFLNNLKGYLEEGVDRRNEMLKQITD